MVVKYLYYNNRTVWLSVCVTSGAGLGLAYGLTGQGPSALGLAGHVGRLAAASALRQGVAVFARLWGHDNCAARIM